MQIKNLECKLLHACWCLYSSSPGNTPAPSRTFWTLRICNSWYLCTASCRILNFKRIQNHYAVDFIANDVNSASRLTCYKPCLAALETKERGRTFQLNMRRESWPPLHQNILNPLEPFEEPFESISENLALFLLIPCLVARTELVMKREAEPKVLTESTYLNHSADIAGGRKFDSICKGIVRTKISLHKDSRMEALQVRIDANCEAIRSSQIYSIVTNHNWMPLVIKDNR